MLTQEEEGSGAGQPVTNFSKKEGEDYSLLFLNPLLPHSREEGPTAGSLQLPSSP